MHRLSPWIAIMLALVLSSLNSPSFAAEAGYGKDPDAGTPSNSARKRSESWQFHDEQEWIVDAIGRDIAEILLFARYRESAPTALADIQFHTSTIDQDAGKYKYELAIKGRKKPIIFEFALDTYVWNPKAYTPWVRALVRELKLEPPAITEPSKEILEKLSDATTETLFGENERVSKELSESPLDAGIHEQAALIQAAFDMRECADIFSDTRPPLCRISAHLALANGLAPDRAPDIVAQITDIALESMSCRDGIAVEKIEKLEPQQADPTIKSWLRALKIRSIGDYRLFPEKGYTALEATQYGLRLANYNGAEAVLGFLEEKRPEPAIWWLRIGLMGRATVGTGHVFNAHATDAELADLTQDYVNYTHDKPATATELIAGMKKTPTRCLRLKNEKRPILQALSWDDVAAFHMRHWLSAVINQYYFLSYLYGVPEQAEAFLKYSRGLLGELPLYPLALTKIDKLTPQEKIEVFKDTQRLIAEHPELLTCAAWDRSNMLGKKLTPPRDGISADLWFSPMVPMGTAYYFLDRYLRLDDSKIDLQYMDKIKAVCPYQNDICQEWTFRKYGQNPTAEQLKEGFGRMCEFDIYAMERVAAADYDSPEKFIKSEEKVCKVDPAHYITLGTYCAENDLPEKAVEYYEKGYESGASAVSMANSCLWLVDYWYDHGQKDKAIEMARFAADVYSSLGLNTLGHLHERMHQLEEAEEIYKKIVDRYDNNRPLCAFYLRHASDSPEYDKEGKSLQDAIFPQGRHRLEPGDLKNPPKAGVKVTAIYMSAMKAGLKEDQVIVGVDGYRVDTFKQYWLIRYLTESQKPKLTIWDGKDYKVIEPKAVNLSVGFEGEDYKPAKN